jgi:hypothetical protein
MKSTAEINPLFALAYDIQMPIGVANTSLLHHLLLVTSSVHNIFLRRMHQYWTQGGHELLRPIYLRDILTHIYSVLIQNVNYIYRTCSVRIENLNIKY